MIEGVKITSLKRIDDERGSVLTMLRSDFSVFKSFGEIYFSTIYHNAIKAWHFHKLMTLNYVTVHGSIKLVLYDDREGSTTKGKVQEIMLSNKNPYLVSIPPKIWNGFCSANNEDAILANCSDIPHDKDEIVRLPIDDPKFPYKWKIS